MLAKLKALNIAPSGPASDATFIRRAYLDAAGILPTSEEVEDFLADKSADKRAKLIDRLLERDEYVDYWAYKWSDLMLISSRKLRANAMWAFYNWIRDSVKEDKPWNKFAYEIFTSSGDTRQNGALNYYVLHKDPIDLTETATEAFMGNRVTCARCHNHPLEKWTQKQYYELVNLFARVGLKNGSEPGDVVVYAKATGDVLHPKLLKPLPPTPLDGTPHVARFHRRPPRAFRRLADQSAEHATSRGPWSIAFGPISWAAAWWNPWTTCAPPIRPPTKSCSRR